MIYETKIYNKSGNDIMCQPSAVATFPLNIPAGDFVVYKGTDPKGPFSRYSKITYLRGAELDIPSGDMRTFTRKILYGGVKLEVREEWVEPERPFPIVEFLNSGGNQLEIIYTEAGNSNTKLRLAIGIPVLASVPCDCIYAKHKKFEIKEPEKLIHNEAGGSWMEELPNHVFSEPRKGDELKRLNALIDEQKRKFLDFLVNRKIT